MKRNEELIAGLDIGTTKVCCIVGERTPEGVDIIGIGTTESRGLRKGVVINIDATVESIGRAIEEGKKRGLGEGSSLRQLYRDDEYHIERWFKYLGFEEQPVIQTMAQFYEEYANDPSAPKRYYEAQILHRGQTRSSFFRITVGLNDVKVEIYRDDARGGPYELRKTFVLN